MSDFARILLLCVSADGIWRIFQRSCRFPAVAAASSRHVFFAFSFAENDAMYGFPLTIHRRTSSGPTTGAADRATAARTCSNNDIKQQTGRASRNRINQSPERVRATLLDRSGKIH